MYDQGMVEGGAVFLSSRCGYFEKWYQDLGNKKRLWDAWYQKWNKEYWSLDCPESMLKPRDKISVRRLYNRILGAVGNDDFPVTPGGEGMGGLLSLYDSAVGWERVGIIHALGWVIERANEHPVISARVVDLADSLSLVELEGSIRRLEKRPVACAHEEVRKAVENYKYYRAFQMLHYPQQLELYRGLVDSENRG